MLSYPGDDIAALVLFIAYGVLAIVGLLNLVLMRRPAPKASEETERPAVLIPARNEAENLKRLLPQVVPHVPRVYVYDDESDDGTAEVAASLGATVIKAAEPPPPGWTGKNRACHELAKIAAEDHSGEWILFLDADLYLEEAFFPALSGWIAEEGRRTPVLTGFFELAPGRGPEPIALGWMPWLLLTTNPYGLVAKTRSGHNFFMNGQVGLWRAEIYQRIRPHEQLAGEILEDVKTGRLLAREKVRVEVANLAELGKVHMYADAREAIDGMSKNSADIVKSEIGTALLAALMLVLGFGWLAAGEHWFRLLALLMLSDLWVAALVRTPWWSIPFIPLKLAVAAYVMLRALYWKRKGLVKWKGRVYPVD